MSCCESTLPSASNRQAVREATGGPAPLLHPYELLWETWIKSWISHVWVNEGYPFIYVYIYIHIYVSIFFFFWQNKFPSPKVLYKCCRCVFVQFGWVFWKWLGKGKTKWACVSQAWRWTSARQGKSTSDADGITRTAASASALSVKPKFMNTEQQVTSGLSVCPHAQRHAATCREPNHLLWEPEAWIEPTEPQAPEHAEIKVCIYV